MKDCKRRRKVCLPENSSHKKSAVSKKEDNDGPMNPKSAAKYVQEILGLDANRTEILARHLDSFDEDPVLVLKENPAWIGVHGQQAADTITDAIANYDTLPGSRRDVAAHRWIFHFNRSNDIDNCKDALVVAHPIAFALSPHAVVLAGGGGQSMPMAWTAVVHKLGVREDDVQRFQFFYG